MPQEYESEFQARLVLALGRLPQLRLWRQNAGNATVVDKSGGRRVIKLAPTGAADLSGIVRGTGQRVEIEVKRSADKRRSPAQVAWARMISGMGGVSVLVHGGMTVEEAVAVVLLAIDLAAPSR